MRATPFLAAIAAALLLAAPAGAEGEAIVPPGNSAAAQYTEAFPTASGERDTDREQKKRSPQKVLGEKNSKQLQEKGPEGKAVADLVAETSPAPDSTAAAEVETAPAPSGSSGKKQQGGGSGQASQGGGSSESDGGAGAAGGAAGNGPNGGSGSGNGAASQAGSGQAGSGSSGVGEVVGQATGASSGELGLFLPLILVAGLLWAVLFAWRRREGQRVA